MKKRFILSFSGGKDCMLSMHRMIHQGWEPACLLTSYNPAQKQNWFHGIPKHILEEISNSLQIPLQLLPCGEGANYNAAFEQALQAWKTQAVNACVFGDIDIPSHRKWNEERCQTVGITPLLPLWGEKRESVVREFIDNGYHAIIKNVRLAELNESFLGKTLTIPLLEEIRSTGADLCGENGEYHTIVVDGPLFRRPVRLRFGEIQRTDTHAFLKLQ